MSKPKHLALTAVAALLLSQTVIANAALSFTYNFQGDYVGNTAAQQNIITAGELFSSMFASHFTNTATLNFDVRSQTDGVASAGTYANVVPGFGTGEVVRNKALGGVDLNGSGSDGFINVNLGLNYQLNPNAPIDFNNGQLDFYSILDHELTHALGFLSLGTTTNDQALTKFDQFLTSLSGEALYDPLTGIRNSAAFDEALANGALFNGENALALNGSPVSIEGLDGDLSHLGTNQFTIPTAAQNALMLCCGNPNSPDQSEPRDYNLAEIGILTDLGYTRVSAVPLPPAAALLLSGFGLFGFAKRRRYNK